MRKKAGKTKPTEKSRKPEQKAFDSNLKTVTIYTDGACVRNPGGAGGYGILFQYEGQERAHSEGFFATTNNRMEMMAAVVALETLKYPCNVVLYTDSQYLQKGLSEWMHKWKKKNWKRGDTPVKNVDLWKRIDRMCEVHNVRCKWIRGHAGQRENEICDLLAKDACGNPTREDAGFNIREDF